MPVLLLHDVRDKFGRLRADWERKGGKLSKHDVQTNQWMGEIITDIVKVC